MQARLPIVIGGRGPKRTLRRWLAGPTIGIWSGGEVAEWKPYATLRSHCEAIGRDPAEIQRSVHVMWPVDADPKALADQAAAFGEVGVDLAIFSMRGPYEVRLVEPLADTLPRFITPVRIS